jgi:peptidylprolyl isomerase
MTPTTASDSPAPTALQTLRASSTEIGAPLPAESLPTVTTGSDGMPALEFPTGDPPQTLQRVVLRQGSGPTVGDDSWVVSRYLGQVWRGAVFDSTYPSSKTAVFRLGEVIPGWTTGLAGVPVGSRVMLIVPPADGYGQRGNASAGIESQDTIVFVIEVIDAFGPERGGQADAVPQPVPPGLPTVTGSLGAAPTISIGGAQEPPEVATVLLARGGGDPARPAMPTGTQVLMQYTAVSWAGENLDSTWPGSTTRTGADIGVQQVPLLNEGPFAGLVGLPIGSRVLVLQPATGAQPASATVVDLVAQT